jgi:hypothetical protein
MHARSAVVEVDVDKIDDAVKVWNEEHLPKYRDQSGYKGFTLLVNRENGKSSACHFGTARTPCAEVTSWHSALGLAWPRRGRVPSNPARIGKSRSTTRSELGVLAPPGRCLSGMVSGSPASGA